MKEIFWRHTPYSHGNKNLKSLRWHLLEKLVFVASKTLHPLLLQRKKTFFPTSNITTSETVWSLYLRFGVHIHIQVMYEIQQLRSPEYVTVLKENCRIWCQKLKRLMRCNMVNSYLKEMPVIVCKFLQRPHHIFVQPKTK